MKSSLMFLAVCLTSPLLAQFGQQGNKLVAKDAAGLAGQGNALAVSADGSTALIGGNNDHGCFRIMRI